MGQVASFVRGLPSDAVLGLYNMVYSGRTPYVLFSCPACTQWAGTMFGFPALRAYSCSMPETVRYPALLFVGNRQVYSCPSVV